MGYLAALIQNIVSSLYAKKGSKTETFRPIDCMPDWDPEGGSLKASKKQTPEEMKSILLGIANIQNRKVKTAQDLNKAKEKPKK